MAHGSVIVKRKGGAIMSTPNTTNIFNPNSIILTFADNTFFNNSKVKKLEYSHRRFISNIQYMGLPLYQIYYYQEKRLWGLSRNKYITNNKWEKSKFYATLEDAKKYANKFYMEEKLEEEHISIKSQSYILYYKKTGPSWRDYIQMEETTYFS